MDTHTKIGQRPISKREREREGRRGEEKRDLRSCDKKMAGIQEAICSLSELSESFVAEGDVRRLPTICSRHIPSRLWQITRSFSTRAQRDKKHISVHLLHYRTEISTSMWRVWIYLTLEKRREPEYILYLAHVSKFLFKYIFLLDESLKGWRLE